MTNPFSFQSQSFPQNGDVPRVGRLITPHGIIETPAFIFCATKGAIKGLLMEDMHIAKTQIILGNTYHLMIAPGADTVQHLGGLARISGWQGPTLTDSGGYQIFSMGYGSVSEEIKGNRKFSKTDSTERFGVKLTEEGALFKSYLNGRPLFLSPESSIDIQEKIGADLIVALDECTPYHADRTYTALSMERSHRWERRSFLQFEKLEAEKMSPALPQALYGIVQGGVYEDLREQSCDFVHETPFFGQAVGGCLGASQDQMYHIVQFTMQRLLNSRPTHLLGIGKIMDIFHGVNQGIDTFDCVHPTRIARHGGALVKAKFRHLDQQNIEREHINLRNRIFEKDKGPIEPDCPCLTCQKYSRGYIHHLLKAKEIAAISLIARHNVFFMNALMAEIRSSIPKGTLNETFQKWCTA